MLNRTQLQGVFDFTLSFSDSPQDGSTPPDKRALFAWPSTFTDSKGLGLKLEPGKAMVEMLLIDHAGRPSEN